MTSQTALPELVRDTRLQATIQGELTIHTRPFGRRRYEKWTRKHILGHGGFGVVWLERRIKDDTQEDDPGESRAVKRIDTSGRRSEHYVRELEALAKFSQDKYSDFFVKFFGWYDSPGYMYIAMEYCEHGDLKKYLADNNNMLPESQVREIISQVLDGVAMMHIAGFANRDIKPANILIKSKPPNSWWVKVCDMGLSKRIEDTGASTSVRGTPGFMPPESHGFYGNPGAADPFMVDMWCLGETAFQALTGRPVFKMLTDLGGYQSGTLSFPEDVLRRAQTGEAAIDFIHSLMRPRPWERLGALRAAEHPWARPAPDPAVDDHGWTQPLSPVLDLSPPWHAGLPMAPGDQLTQASGQWTVTIPYSSLTYNLPQGSGFQDPTFAEEKDERSIVSEHYISLKRYLSVTWGDGNPNPPLSKHGYELQRLTSSQFLELSTDVGDELKRREFASRRPSNVPPGAGPPDYLLPEENFHPKRNEARQKMSSLRAPRFRDLATAVFCELERRFPRFAAGDIHRVKSAMSNP